MSLKRIYKPYGRAYQDAEGREYPGVTSILNVMDKKLDNWKMNMMGKAIVEKVHDALEGKRLLNMEEIIKESKGAADAYRDEKGNRGIYVHKVIEKHFNDEDITKDRAKDAKLDAIMFQVEKWIKDNDLKPVLVEAYLLSKEHGYAGGVDLVVRRNNGNGPELVLVDIKTGRTLQDENVWQMAAYAKAYEEMYGEPIDMAFILHIDFDNQIIAEEKHTSKAEIPAQFNNFMGVYGAFKARWGAQLNRSRYSSVI